MKPRPSAKEAAAIIAARKRKPDRAKTEARTRKRQADAQRIADAGIVP